SFIDTNLQITRISVQMANIGTKDIQRIKDELKPKIDSIFPPSRYNVIITGTSVVFLKGTNYLVKNLMTSLLLALIVISLLMALLFTSARMIGISLIPNLIPQIMTAGMMGFFLISIKPSTILIFSIALGISVDNAIHFLSRYRLQLKLNNWNIKESAIAALRETGYSMIYSSVVLFFGFGIFTLSSFGGTEALGYLVAFTLLIALLSNLFILPSLILTLDKRITTRRFKEPLLEIFDEEEDIDLNELEIEQIDTRGSA
ncbi:MAG: MMPL family transporter, partial [Bacteroidales bacterium]|nr:MMPL family transporter [Bacteroidales bacterium]